MESDEETDAPVVALLLVKTKKKLERSTWVKPWLRRRINLGFYETFVQELRFDDESEHKSLLHMTPKDLWDFQT